MFVKIMQGRSRREMITYLINNTKMVDVKNGNGKTALDLLLEQGGIPLGAFRVSKGSRRKLNRLLKDSRVDREILRSLAEAEALMGEEAMSYQERYTNRLKWLETRNDAIMIVAALIATMAFQATVSPPGGVWQDNLLDGPNPHKAGEAILAQTNPKYYGHLIRANTVAFVSSLSTIILLVRGIAAPRLWWLFFVLSTAVWLSIAAIAITYAISFVTVAPKSETGILSGATEIVIIVIMVWGFNSVITAAIFWPRRRSRPSFAFDPNI